MSITLTPEQETWIKAHVATGDFASVEEAARQLIDDRIAELAHDEGTNTTIWHGRSLWLTRAWRRSNAASSSRLRNTRRVTPRAVPRSGNSGARRHHRTGGRQFHRDYPRSYRKAGELVADRYEADFDALYLRLATFPESGSPRPKLAASSALDLFRLMSWFTATCPTKILSPSSALFTGDAGSPAAP